MNIILYVIKLKQHSSILKENVLKTGPKNAFVLYSRKAPYLFCHNVYFPSKHQKAALGQIKHSILCSFICSDILYTGGGVAPSLPDHDDPNMPSRQVTGQA